MHSISERVHYETESDDAVQYARLAEEKRESDAKAWHSISVSTDVARQHSIYRCHAIRLWRATLSDLRKV